MDLGKGIALPSGKGKVDLTVTDSIEVRWGSHFLPSS